MDGHLRPGTGVSPAFRNVLIFSGLLKVVLAIVFGDLPPRYDEVEFLSFGRAVLEEGAAPRLWRAPGYQWFVAAGLFLGGGSAVGVRLLQVALSIAASWITYRTGRRLGGERVGLAAGAFVACYPAQISFSHMLWSETLYGFLAIAAFDRSLAAEDRGCARTAGLAGVLFGATALTRSLGIALLGATVLAWGIGRRPRLALAALVGAAVVIVPWAIDASDRAGRLVIVDTNSGFNVWSGNNEYIPSDLPGLWSLGLGPENGIDVRFLEFRPGDFWRREVPVRMDRADIIEPEGPDGDLWYRSEGLTTIREDPVGALARIPRKLAALWAPDFFLPRHLLRDWYGETPPAVAAGLTLLGWVMCTVPLLLGPVALAALRPSRFRRLITLWILAYAAAHALAYGHARMHQPLVPLLVLAAAAFLFDRAARGDRRRLLRQGIPAAAVAIGLWIHGSAVVGGLYLAPGPRHVAFARGLAVGRYLPLAGAERLTWMLAEAEASAGNDGVAERVLLEGPHAGHPWSQFLAALVTEDHGEAVRRLERALAIDPAHGPAHVVMTRLRDGGALPATRPDLFPATVPARRASP